MTTRSGEKVVYDHVILACHSDAALGILRAGGHVTPQEEKVLGGFQWSQNEAVLHSDVRVRFRVSLGEVIYLFILWRLLRS